MVGFNFCPWCGERLPPNSNFCPTCGERLTVVRRQKGGRRTSLLTLYGSWSSILMAFFLAANVFLAFWMAPEISELLLTTGFPILASSLLPPFVFILVVLEGSAALVAYWFVLVAILISFIIMIWKSRDISSELKGLRTEDPSPLFAVTTVFSALLLVNIVYYFVIGSLGIEPNIPLSAGQEEQIRLFSVLQAVVTEEINDRMILIGLPLALLVLLGRKEGVAWKMPFGGMGLGRAELILIIFSSMIFALSHLEGWDVWKLIPTFISGLGLGYLFVRYGIHASIMLHFCFNFLSAYMIYTGSLLAAVFTGLMIFYLLILGVPFLIVYTIRSIRATLTILSANDKNAE